MDELDKIQSALSKVLGSRERGASAFFLGSTREQGASSFIPDLSDIDLLLVPESNSLKAYREWVDDLVYLNKELNRPDGQLFDIFALSRNIAAIHFACLSTLAGRVPREEDTIFGKQFALKSITSDDVYKRLYKAEFLIFRQRCLESFPVADTSRARKTAKFLLRFIKVFICACDSKTELSHLEAQLCDIKDFSGLQEYLKKITNSSLPQFDLFQKALDGETVDDWPAWMMAQEELTYWLVDNTPDFFKDKSEQRFFVTVCQVRDMLMLGLKDILSLQDDEERRRRIGEFADKTASILVKLAMSRVVKLADLTTETTPIRVKDSYEVLVHHLKSTRADEMCLAASVILLEYALEESVLLG